MDEAAAEDGAVRSGRHIKKRALKNKAVTISFDEKDLKDFVTGFHKRKKKRRKEALQNQEEAARRKRIELRKKRKLERESVYGESQADSVAEAGESDEENEDVEEPLPLVSVSGVQTYNNGEMQVVVMTSEIGREEEVPNAKPEGGKYEYGSFEKSKLKLPVAVKRKPMKKNPKKRSRLKPQSKRDRRKGKKKNLKQF